MCDYVVLEYYRFCIALLYGLTQQAKFLSFYAWDCQIYYSEEMHVVSVETIEGRCEVRKKHDLPSCDAPALFEHMFFCEYFYDPAKGSLKQVC